MGKGSKPKKQKAKNKAAPQQAISQIAVIDTNTNRPTDQRRGRGTWANPQGAMKSHQPVVDLASDMVGALHVAKQITDSQEQAARLFQRLRRAYLAELPEVEGFRSCIAPHVPGYDDSDGNPAVIAAYRTVEGKLTFRQRTELLHVCDDGKRPYAMDILRVALDLIGG